MSSAGFRRVPVRWICRQKSNGQSRHNLQVSARLVPPDRPPYSERGRQTEIKVDTARLRVIRRLSQAGSAIELRVLIRPGDEAFPRPQDTGHVWLVRALFI